MKTLGLRLGQALATAWVIATLCFGITHALPGDIALSIAIARVGADRATPEVEARVRNDEALNRPLLVQYGHWMSRVMRGDLGRSLVSRKPVIDEILYHARFTLGLGVLGWALSYALALPLGIACGLRPGGLVDRVVTGLTVLFAALPSFLVGIGLITLFALTLRWFPPAGFKTPAHLVLPALTLALSLTAFSVPVIRAAVREVARAPYMQFARLRGLPKGAALRHHGVRNAAIPIITFAALQMGFLIDGFVIVETLFNYPGMGDLLVRALVARDIPIILGCALLISLLYALVNLLADAAALVLDPRRRRLA
ncbi:ABC transporter permease [Elstera cyanobacteriorum]|uniref:ABC transporter permease n=1 Tax=Elstera cyanobacteriorum TaxID=2022747 RepID=UPI0023578549|nr:ABC transporter permease [Elstera cyanobacteriorum]MCK6444267.1 ABC transporter permease [Elstera cyanobacteriorum]